MRLLKTIYKGCNEGIAEPHCSHIVRFSLSTCASHATLMSMLGSAFLFAQQNADDNLTDKPFNICVLWPVDEHTKRKPENAGGPRRRHSVSDAPGDRRALPFLSLGRHPRGQPQSDE